MLACILLSCCCDKIIDKNKLCLFQFMVHQVCSCREKCNCWSLTVVQWWVGGSMNPSTLLAVSIFHFYATLEPQFMEWPQPHSMLNCFGNTLRHTPEVCVSPKWFQVEVGWQMNTDLISVYEVTVFELTTLAYQLFDDPLLAFLSLSC